MNKIKELFLSQLNKNVVSGIVSTIINMGITVFSIPIYLSYLGYEKLGVWFVLATVISFVQMFNFGIGPAITKHVASEFGKGNYIEIPMYVSTAVISFVTIGLVVLLVLVFFGEEVLGLFALNSNNMEIAMPLIPYAGLLTAYILIVQIFSATLAGLGRMDQVNYRDCLAKSISLIIAIIFLHHGFGVSSLLIGNLFGTIFIHFISIYLIHNIIKIPIIRVYSWEKNRFFILLKFGTGIFATSLAGLFFIPFSKIMLSRYAGVSALPLYEISLNIAMQIRGIIEVAFRALMPEVSRIAVDRTNEVQLRIIDINRNSTKFTMMFAFPIYLITWLIAPFILKSWLGEQFLVELPPIFRIALLATFISLLGVPYYNTIIGLGKVWITFIAHFSMSTINIAIVSCIILKGIALTPYMMIWALVPAMTFSTIYLILKGNQVVSTFHIEPVGVNLRNDR